jgi:hypothetical protein
MRRKVYTKEQILKAAYEVVEKEGFAGFTARNIAKKMGISTQPIYLEFKNMDDLKNTLLDEIYDHLYNEVFPKVYTGDKLVDLGISYIRFAKEQPHLFSAIYVEEYGGGKKMHDFSYNYFYNLIKHHEKYKNLSDEEIAGFHTGSWITVTGIATLSSSGIINPSVEELAKMVQAGHDSTLSQNNKEVLSILGSL